MWLTGWLRRFSFDGLGCDQLHLGSYVPMHVMFVVHMSLVFIAAGETVEVGAIKGYFSLGSAKWGLTLQTEDLGVPPEP